MTIAMRERQFADSWDIFLIEHQLQPGETLVSVRDKRSSTYTFLTFDKDGVDGQFPWYNMF